jgi:phage-related protein
MKPLLATSPYGNGYEGFPWRTESWSVATFRRREFGWPLGMPYCRGLGNGLWEVRSDLTDGKIGRVIFCVARERMVLLHGFVKKTQKIPERDLKLAVKRMKEVLSR